MENLWLGGAVGHNIAAAKITGVLNVAQDLRGYVGWPEVDYMQVGLVDGPGNPIAAYCSAVLALETLLRRARTLICCHSGSRSMAVVLMYLNAAYGGGWDGCLVRLNERVDMALPVPHAAHRAAFDKVNWKLLSTLLKD